MGDLERLGDSDDFGYALIDILERDGWKIWIRRAFAGDGVMIMGEQNELGVTLTASGPRVSDAAVTFFEQCCRRRQFLGMRKTA